MNNELNQAQIIKQLLEQHLKKFNKQKTELQEMKTQVSLLQQENKELNTLVQELKSKLKTNSLAHVLQHSNQFEETKRMLVQKIRDLDFIISKLKAND